MALTACDVQLWERLRSAGQIPPKPRVLEIGEANWHGSTPPPSGCEDACPFVVAKKFYKKVLDYREIVAVDMQGTPAALRLNLNRPLWGECSTFYTRLEKHGEEIRQAWNTYDIIINTGTAEHVFNQYQVFKTIHDFCAVGGLMVHAAPWQGWINHGFYCYQPCFWEDLAAANDYEMLLGLTYEFEAGRVRDNALPAPSGDTMLYVAMRKRRSGDFKVPMQRSLGIA